MKKALALASICEFGGAVLMGAGGEHVQQQPALLPRPRCAVSGLLASPQLCIAASHHRWAAWQPATAHPVLHPWPVPPPDRAQPPPPPPAQSRTPSGARLRMSTRLWRSRTCWRTGACARWVNALSGAVRWRVALAVVGAAASGSVLSRAHQAGRSWNARTDRCGTDARPHCFSFLKAPAPGRRDFRSFSACLVS